MINSNLISVICKLTGTIKLFNFAATNFLILQMACQFAAINFLVSLAYPISYNKSIKFSLPCKYREIK